MVLRYTIRYPSLAGVAADPIGGVISVHSVVVDLFTELTELVSAVEAMARLAERPILRRFYLGLDSLVDLAALALGVEAFLCAALSVVLLAVLIERGILYIGLRIVYVIVLLRIRANIVVLIAVLATGSRPVDLGIGVEGRSHLVVPNI